MNRRKAIFAMMCAAFGKRISEAQNGLVITNPQKGSFHLGLDDISAFEFEFRGLKITLSSEEVWKALQP